MNSTMICLPLARETSKEGDKGERKPILRFLRVVFPDIRTFGSTACALTQVTDLSSPNLLSCVTATLAPVGLSWTPRDIFLPAECLGITFISSNLSSHPGLLSIIRRAFPVTLCVLHTVHLVTDFRNCSSLWQDRSGLCWLAQC